jgi:PKD domain
MRNGCTQLWEFLASLWTAASIWQDIIFTPWKQCTAQRSCYWWCLCCNKWLCWIALILLFIFVLTWVIILTLLLIAIIGICETLCGIGVVASGKGSCFIVSGTPAPPPAITSPPVANAGGPYTGYLGYPLRLIGQGSTDPQGATLSYSWDCGDGGTATGINPQHSYAALGTYTVTLTVSNGPLSATATTTAVIVIAPPGGPPSPPVSIPVG